MQASHSRGAVSATFDDPNLVSCAGLVPVMRLAHTTGLADLADRFVKIPGPAGANPAAKIGSIVAGMAAGADSIDDLAVIRHGALPVLFDGIRAPSTLGTFLRGLCWGDVACLEAVNRRMLTRLAETAPLLPNAQDLAFLDIDSKIKEVYGPGKQGNGFGYTKVRGLNYLIVTLTTPGRAPVILETRLRGGNADSRRGAASLITRALTLARGIGATGPIVVRADSAFFTGPIVAAIRHAGAHFSITVPMRSNVRAAIDTITEDSWQSVTYAKPVLDHDTGQWITGAEIAETTLTSFTNSTENPGRRVTARLLVRRYPDTDTGQQALFPAWRYHAVFTDSPFDLPTAEGHHRGHAIVEQVFADLNDSALAHFPSGKFAANAAWLTLAALTHNLLRATGCLAGDRHTNTRTGTLRHRLVTVAARISRTARTITLHLPARWPWHEAWTRLFTTAHAPPPTH